MAADFLWVSGYGMRGRLEVPSRLAMRLLRAGSEGWKDGERGMKYQENLLQ
jgi:hypothetical protein